MNRFPSVYIYFCHHIKYKKLSVLNAFLYFRITSKELWAGSREMLRAGLQQVSSEQTVKGTFTKKIRIEKQAKGGSARRATWKRSRGLCIEAWHWGQGSRCQGNGAQLN